MDDYLGSYKPVDERATLGAYYSNGTGNGSKAYASLGSATKTSRNGTRRTLVLVSSSAVMSQCQLVKWIFLVTSLVVAGFSNWAVLAYTHDFSTREPLPDILFSLFPEQQWASQVGDYMVSVTVACFVALLVFHRARAIVARRFLFTAATLYAFRSLTLIATQLPPGYEDNALRCRDQVNLTADILVSRVFEQAIRAGFQNKTKLLCGDMLFSGHTLSMVLSALFIAYYLPSRWQLLQYVPVAFTVLGVVCVIISRTHYTIDIVIAYLLTNFVFRLYHAFCEVDVFMERRKSVLYGLWIFWIVEWLEDDVVPGKVKNEFEFPIDGLLRLLLRERALKHHKQISISSASTFNLQ